MALSINSPAFGQFEAIPRRFTCDGDDMAPALRWSGVPEGAQSLVLIADDPDAPDPAKPTRTFVHWVLYNLPPSTRELPEGVTARELPPGAREGRNDWNRMGYNGPCPPVGRHRYFFRLHALDTVLHDLRAPTKADVEAAMANHLLAAAELVGTYERTQEGRRS